MRARAEGRLRSGGKPRGRLGKCWHCQWCFNEAPVTAAVDRHSVTPRTRQAGGQRASGRYPPPKSPRNLRRTLLEVHPASTGPRSSRRSARGRPGAACTRRTAARSQPPSTLDPSRSGLRSEERAHVSRVRGAVIGPDDMEAGRGSEPARTGRGEQQPLVAGRAASPTAHSSGCALVVGLAVERPVHAKCGAETLTGSPGEAASPAPPPEQAGAGVDAPAQRRTPTQSAPFMGNSSPWEPTEQAVSTPAGSERPSRGGGVEGEPWSTAPDRILPPAPPLRRARGGGPSPPESRSRHAFFHRWLAGRASRSNGAPSGWAMCEPSLMGRAAFGATLEAQAAPFYGGGKEAASPQQKEATDQ